MGRPGAADTGQRPAGRLGNSALPGQTAPAETRAGLGLGPVTTCCSIASRQGRRLLLRCLLGLLAGGCLLLMLLSSRPQQPAADGVDALLRRRPARPTRPPGPVRQRLAAPDRPLRQLTLADVMTSLHGSTDLELVRSGRLRRPSACPPQAVVPWAGGRTGNLVFEYLAAWALARWNGVALLIPDQMVEEFEGVFPALSAQRGDLDVLMIDCAAAWEARRRPELDTVDDVNLNLRPGEWIELLGFPNSITEPVYKLVQAYDPELREELRFSDGVVDVVQEYLWRVRRSLAPDGDDVTFVGVHARRADYYDAMFNVMGVWMSTPDERYFSRGIRHYQERYSNVVFLVVSDDMAWCRQHLAPLADVVLFPGGTEHPAVLDLALLAHCNHSLITYGTFALTGALLNGGETVVAADVGAHFTFYDRQRPYWAAEWHEISVQ